LKPVIVFVPAYQANRTPERQNVPPITLTKPNNIEGRAGLILFGIDIYWKYTRADAALPDKLISDVPGRK
jgi:hypothetical protein